MRKLLYIAGFAVASLAVIRSQRELREAHLEEMRARDEAARLISGVE